MEATPYILKPDAPLAPEEVAKIARGLKSLAAHAYLNCACSTQSKPEQVDTAVEQGLQAIDKLFGAV